jgi:Protein of unknown function (DUF2750)
MPWNPSKDEIRAILSCEGAKRYEYLVKKTCDQEVVFSLWNDGWLLSADSTGNSYFPIWPHPAYAEICAEGEWKGSRAKAITLSDWMERWTTGLIADKRIIAAFPTKDNRGVSVAPLKFHDDLKSELENY